MFYYELYSWNDTYTLSHEQRITPDRFKGMCEEIDVSSFDERNIEQITAHLTNNYGFKRVRAMADYFINER